MDDRPPGEKLRAYWRSRCDGDPVPCGFDEEMEASGLITWRSVTKRDIEDDTFAAERGIEMGGAIWVLTAAGRRALEED